MTPEQLQLVADTVWITIGIDGFGVTISDQTVQGFITVDVAGFDAGTMYHFSETFPRHAVEAMRGNTRYNYIREIARCLRKAITDLRMCQIRESLGD